MWKHEQAGQPSALWLRFRLPFLSAFFSGLLAHGFWLTNKIPVEDDLPFFFSKGATTVSGRWGLELLRFILPDLSMPWLYGLLSLLLLSVCACLIVQIFAIRSPWLQGLLSALFISFPAEAGTISYTFTCLPYAIALLLAVTSVALFQRGGKSRLASPLALLLSCSIYQGYFAFASSFFVLLLLRDLLHSDKTVKALIAEGFRMLGVLVAGASLYGLSILALSRLFHMPLLAGDAINSGQNLLIRAALCYSALLHTFTRGYFGYVRTPLSLACHGLLLALAMAQLISSLRGKPAVRWLLAALGLFLLPPSTYCLYLLAGTGYIHSLALYSFFSCYLFAGMLLDRARFPAMLRPAPALLLTLVLAGNLSFANAYSLCSQMEFEQTRAFYTGLITRVQSTPGYDGGCSLALVGEADAQRAPIRDHFDFGGFQLPGNNITRSVQAPEFLRLYLGWEIPLAGEEEVLALRQSGALSGMSLYPSDGSVRKVGDCIVVLLSEDTD